MIGQSKKAFDFLEVRLTLFLEWWEYYIKSRFAHAYLSGYDW